jgi:hypothetical protein
VTDCIDFPHVTDFAIEDFRIFQWKETILLNHSFVTKEETDTFVRQAKVQSALSVLDINNKKINFWHFLFRLSYTGFLKRIGFTVNITINSYYFIQLILLKF